MNRSTPVPTNAIEFFQDVKELHDFAVYHL